jgi:hypothetical protein
MTTGIIGQKTCILRTHEKYDATWHHGDGKGYECIALPVGTSLRILIMKANEKHYYSNLCDQGLYMFRSYHPLSLIISISTLYTRNRYLSF